MKYIQLTQGKSTIVDDEDYDYLISLGKWCAESPDNSHRFYAYKKIKKTLKTARMHRVVAERAFGVIPIGYTVDHINGDSLDNTRTNLRICSNKQNVRNSSKWRQKTSSIYKGVTWHKRGKAWMAHIVRDGKSVYLGLFRDEKLAAMAYNERALVYFGQYARLNKIS